MAAAETPAMEEAAKEVVMAVANAEALLVEHSQRGWGLVESLEQGGGNAWVSCLLGDGPTLDVRVTAVGDEEDDGVAVRRRLRVARGLEVLQGLLKAGAEVGRA